MGQDRLFDLGLMDKRSHHKLIIRLWAVDEEAASWTFINAGLEAEYVLRYVRVSTYQPDTGESTK